ncbi:MAG: glucosyltransferase domain-containing protein [Ruminococcus sp.]|nr:glucosyltransferase domain-containing protein [Ruminococcus sp.]MDE6784271.1 glucosyltransferase domain-containing protein [Ruminococcus sp.]
MQSEKDSLDCIILNKVKKMDKRIWIVLISSVVWGIFAHGMTLFNKYSVRDDARHLFDIGGTVTSGRWGLAVLGKLYMILFGDGFYSLPLFNGFISILCIAASAYLIINLLDIKQTLLCISITGILISFPTITGIFGYMFTAPYYMISILLAVAGVWVVNRKRSVLYFSIGVLLMAFSIGIYQAFIPVMLSLAVLYFIYRLTDETINKPKEPAISKSYIYMIYNLGAVVSGVLMYFLITKCSLVYTGRSLSDYKNINNMGKEPVSVYLSRVITAFYRFFVPEDMIKVPSMFPFRIRHIYILILLFIAVLSLNIIIKTFRKSIFRGTLLTLSILILPLAFSFIFVMCDPKSVSTLMLYGQSMIFVYLVFLLNISEFPELNITRAVYGSATALMLFLSFSYCRYANINYLKAEYEQQRMISYFTVLITQIKSVEGYQDEMPVCYINPNSKEDLTLEDLSEFGRFYISPILNTKKLINTTWKQFMNNWCGFSPELADEEDFADLPEVIDMPYYPDDGSIKVINDTVVVKFGPVEE